MNIFGVKISIIVSLLFFALLPDSDQVQDRVALWHTKQGSDLLIGSSSLPHAVCDMNPASTKAILLYCKKNI